MVLSKVLCDFVSVCVCFTRESESGARTVEMPDKPRKITNNRAIGNLCFEMLVYRFRIPKIKRIKSRYYCQPIHDMLYFMLDIKQKLFFGI